MGVPLRCAPGRAARAVGNDTTVANGAEPPPRQGTVQLCPAAPGSRPCGRASLTQSAPANLDPLRLRQATPASATASADTSNKSCASCARFHPQETISGSSSIWMQASRVMVLRRCSAIVRRNARCRRSRGGTGKKVRQGAIRVFLREPPSCSSVLIRASSVLIRAHPCSSVLIPIIRRRRRRRRCVPEAHRTQPPRTPDARSGKLSECERAGAFPPRSCEGTVHGIAHQVKPDGGLRCAPEDDGVPS